MPVEFEFACPLAAGLHARPASLLSEMANSLACECVLTNLRTGVTANLKSTLAIIGADVRSGDECRITLSGESEQQALATIRRWVEDRLPSVDEPLAQPAGPKQTAKLPRALQDSGCTYVAGTPVSAGIGSGKAVHAGAMALPAPVSDSAPSSPAYERQRMTQAVAAVSERIGMLRARARSKTESAILNAHLAILRDVSLTGQIEEFIDQGQPAPQAVVKATNHFRDILRRSDSAYIRERALDLQDIRARLLEELGGVTRENKPVTLSGPSVIVAESLTPQELLNLNREHVSGLILEYAGATSHTVILARSLGIPTLAGVPGASAELADGECVIVDGTRGFVIKSDAPAVERFYAREFDTQRRRQARLGQAASASAKTVDGRRLEVAANVSSPVEIRAAFESGADGVGVFRTEMLFVDRDTAPTEEEQFEIYAEAARAAAGRPVIIRTLDIGGDKRVPHLHLPQEPNPFLGYRGARIYPEHVEMFRSQVRAILRASAFGRVQIMLPMISSAEEVRWAREQVAQVRRDLQAAGTSIADVPLGIMIEVPSVAYALAEMSGVADFFSIGTNDLSQYFFAADRGNARVWPLANSMQPAFLRFLKQIVDEARARKKWIGICGEMGGELKLLPLMLGLGFDEISAAVPNIPALKHGVSRLRQADCEKLLADAMACHSAEEVGALLERAPSAAEPLPLLAREMVIIQSDSNNKEEAIRELVDTLYVAGRTDDRQQLEDAVWAREEVYSTALGFGFAVPHCKSDAARADSIAVVKLARPIAWGAEESGGVDFAILLAMRESARDNAHMQVFSRLARKLMNEDFRAQLTGANDADSVLKLLMTVDEN